MANKLAESLLALISLPKQSPCKQDFNKKEDEQNVQLPKPPVPDLQKTMDTYLELAGVVVSAQQLERTRALVRGFMEEQGPRLQEALLERQKKMDNWITDWWLDDMYLKVRMPLPINSNPGMVFPRENFKSMDDVADLATLYIEELLEYKEMLIRGTLPVERAPSREKGQPLCMRQFDRLIGVCRIPEQGKDRLELPDSSDRQQDAIVVAACKNYFYPITVETAERGRLPPGEIQAQLMQCMVEAAGAPPAPRVGLLTSMNRDEWAKAREQLIKADESNRTNMEMISRALCLICLDGGGGDRPDLDADTNAMLRILHGAGTEYHSANRWFDKTLQFIISSDGTRGLCYEHSASDGVVLCKLAEQALARRGEVLRSSVVHPAPKPMRWTVPAEVLTIIEAAGAELDRAIKDLDFKVHVYKGYGREFMKSCNTSPDVYIQLALQYAYYKMYGHLVSTYESASVRRFLGGRVDNIRSAHGAALAWAKAMCDTDAADQEQKKQKKLELFREAACKQTSIMEATILGRGIDNHLMGLREAAREQGQLPAIFSDDTYRQMNEFKLSTSQTATSIPGTFRGYGAVVPDGYGCSYNPKSDHVIFCVSSFASSDVTSTETFTQSVMDALDSMKVTLQNKTEN